MKVLIISQPVLSKTNNMGKTLMGYFSSFKPTEVAQLYLRNGVPNNTERCLQYYRFSDEDAVHSIYNHKVTGTKFNEENIKVENVQPQSSADVYKIGSKHKAWMLLLRDLMWRFSSWKNSDLLGWVKEVDPDVVFFAAGDGGFSYRIANYLAKYLNKPLVVVCMDDFFVNNRNKGELLGAIRQKLFMRTVKRTMGKAAAVFTICDSMNRVYSQMFGVPCYTLHTAAARKVFEYSIDANQISYIGSVGCGRYKSLLEMGKALSTMQSEGCPKCIDVYTGSYQPEYIDPLKNAPGIRFHGSIPAEEVLNVMSKSIAVIHTESFEQNMMDMVRFSVSTKIAESLMYGPCLIAYGPEGIASIDYLKENKAAWTITDPEDLEKGLEEILGNSALREKIVRNARKLAEKNHNADVNPKKVREWLEQIIKQVAPK